jgi:hypothetical protein
MQMSAKVASLHIRDAPGSHIHMRIYARLQMHVLQIAAAVLQTPARVKVDMLQMRRRVAATCLTD